MVYGTTPGRPLSSSWQLAPSSLLRSADRSSWRIIRILCCIVRRVRPRERSTTGRGNSRTNARTRNPFEFSNRFWFRRRECVRFFFFFIKLFEHAAEHGRSNVGYYQKPDLYALKIKIVHCAFVHQNILLYARNTLLKVLWNMRKCAVFGRICSLQQNTQIHDKNVLFDLISKTKNTSSFKYLYFICSIMNKWNISFVISLIKAINSILIFDNNF